MAERSLRVLLIEDDPDDYVLTRELLTETAGFRVEVEWASTYAEGLTAVRRCRHDLLIVDYFLGAHLGTELLREAAGAGCRAPIIVLTGQPSQEVDVKAMEVGAAEFLVKGELDPLSLERAMRHALERKRSAEEQRLLAEAGKLLGALHDHHTTLRSIAQLLVPALGDSCVIDIVDSNGRLQRATAVASDPERERLLLELRQKYPMVRLSGHPAHRVLASGESVLIAEVTDELLNSFTEIPQERELLRRLQLTSFMLVPIRIRSRTLGVMSLGTYESRRRYDARDVELAEELGRRAAVAVDNARLFREAQEAEEQIRRHAARLQVLSHASKLFTEARLQRETVLRSVTELVTTAIGDAVVARLLSEDGLRLIPLASDHRPSVGDQGTEPEPQSASEGIHGAVVTTGAAVRIAGTDADAGSPGVAAETGGMGWAGAARSILVVPLRVHDRVIGTLELTRWRTSDPYSREDQVLVQELADRAGQAIDNARLYEEAQRALRTRDEVMAIVSHDLRDPLHTIQMCALLLADMDLPEQQRQMQSQIIERAAKRAERLIEDLLDVARMEAGKFVVETGPTEVPQLVEETCDMLQARLDGQGIALECALPADLPPVEADRHRVLQLLSNLVGNAIKFTRSGGRITIGSDVDGEQVRLWVRNTGDGIPPQQRPHLFDRFWQARQANRGGAGLGLAISKGIVEAHGGEIWVESEVGEHATFYFTLPLARRPEVQGSLHEPSAEPASAS